MSAALPRHWREYLIEAWALGTFMVSAGLFGTLLFAADSPLAALLPEPLLRRALMGLAMGATAIALIYSPWGQRSGAHMNPAVTVTFFRLGKLARRDLAGYLLAQALGGVSGVLLVAALVGERFTAPPVSWVATRPGPWGPGVAFAAEVAISALLMAVVLLASNSPRFARATGLFAGALVALYITFEDPLSGMSMNPARSFASALPSGLWQSFWIYLAAPPLGMLLAAEGWRAAGRRALCAKLHHTERHDCIFRCGYCRHSGGS